MSIRCSDLCCFIRFTLHLVGLFVVHPLFSQNIESRPGMCIKQDDCLNYDHFKKRNVAMDAFKISVPWEAVAPLGIIYVFILSLVRFRAISESGNNFFVNLLVQRVHVLLVRSFTKWKLCHMYFMSFHSWLHKDVSCFRWVACSPTILTCFVMVKCSSRNNDRLFGTSNNFFLECTPSVELQIPYCLSGNL